MKQPIIKTVSVVRNHVIAIECNNGKTYEIDFSVIIKSDKLFSKIKAKEEFATVSVGLWGHFIEWSCGLDVGADRLIALASEQKGESIPVERFHAWRERNQFTYDRAAQALGISRRMVAYYESGLKPIPRYVGLACMGWEASNHLAVSDLISANDDTDIKMSA